MTGSDGGSSGGGERSGSHSGPGGGRGAGGGGRGSMGVSPEVAFHSSQRALLFESMRLGLAMAASGMRGKDKRVFVVRIDGLRET